MANSQVADSPKIAAAETGEHERVRLAAVVAALSRALDLSTGQPLGHSIRTCLLGMRIGEEYGFNSAQLNELFYALLLKDCGCSGNSSKTFHALQFDDLKAKHDVKTVAWTEIGWDSLRYTISHAAIGKPIWERLRVLFTVAKNRKSHARDVTKIRCERGSTLARLMRLPEGTAAAILDLDEHWDGNGNPEELAGEDINACSRIMLLAQTLENFASVYSKDDAIQVAKKRSRKWFDPELVKVTAALNRQGSLWQDFEAADHSEPVLRSDREEVRLAVGDDAMDSICCAFAQIVDAKSPFTHNHSNGVANASVAIATGLGLSPERIMFVRHAALLHDLGKLGISNQILEKPGKLTDEEFATIKQHPRDTWRILHPIPEFAELTEVAASHHEKLNGKGYFRNLTAEQLSTEARIVIVADIFDALAADRPYRDGMPLAKVFSILDQDVPHALDGDCVMALKESGIGSDQTFKDLFSLQESLRKYQ